MKVWRLAAVGIALLWLGSAAVRAQQKPTDAQVKEIKDKLEAVKKAEKEGKQDEVAKLKQEVIDLVDKYYKIPQDNADGDPKYDPASGDDGDSKRSGKKVKVTLGEATFTTPGWVASTKIHEILGHGGQAKDDRWYKGAKGDAINDIECYDLELKNAEITGLSEAEIAELKRRRKALYDSLDDDNKKKIDKKDYTMTVAPPAEHRPAAPAPAGGKPKLFVAGTVLEEESMAVTVQGPSTLQGMVVSAEMDGKKTETRTDAQGHARIDFGALAGAAGNAVVRVLDASGKEVAREQVSVVPRTPETWGPPHIPAMPPLLRNGDQVTIPGQNLGADSQLVVGGRAQETLAASSRELTATVNAPKLGPQTAYVTTPNGVTPSQPVSCYNFSIQLKQSTIMRGQTITASGMYEGLPPGTQIVFTNASPSVVTMSVAGAQNQGEQSIVTVTQPAGTIQVELVGKSSGPFVINYDVRPPQSAPPHP